MPQPFSLDNQGISVSEMHRNASPAFLYEAALRFEKGSTISSTGALIAYSGKKTGRSPTDKRVVDEPEVRDDVWWGSVNIKLDPHSFLDQPRARDRLPEHARAAVRRRWLRRLGSEVPAQDPRHLRARLSRAVHAQHADPADEGSARVVRRARLRDLQRGRLPREPPHAGHDVDDLGRSVVRPPRVRHPRHRVRRRDEEGRVHDHELPDAEAGRAVDALLGDAGARRRPTRRSCSACRAPARRRSRRIRSAC